MTHFIRLDNGRVVHKELEMSSFDIEFAPTPGQIDRSMLDSTLSEAKEESFEGSGSHSVLVHMKGELQPEPSNYPASQSTSLLKQPLTSNPFFLNVEPPCEEKPQS